MDDIDRKILEILQEDGRIANVTLAKRVGLSPPSVLRRVKKLETQGVIKKYVALVDREKIGKNLLVFIAVSITPHGKKREFAREIQNYPEILECYHLTGEIDYLIKVAVSHINELEDFILNRITRITGVDKVVTSLVLSEVKNRTALPL